MTSRVREVRHRRRTYCPNDGTLSAARDAGTHRSWRGARRGPRR
jgi:hypothetical protein